jgi:GNAT superfamily N-acetyltransferase
LEIGRVRQSDLEAISQLHIHFWGEPSDIGAMSETLTLLDQNPGHIFLAARIDGACVGTATGVVCHGLYGGFDSYMVIEDVVVDEVQRRQGIASALVTELERLAREASCRQMIVLSESVRHDAHGLYGALGFEARWTGFKKKLDGGAEQALQPDAPDVGA